MSEPSDAKLAGCRLRRMTGRDIHETHRVSTPLELLFDLTFVVAIAAVASQLHHAVGAHSLGSGLLGYAMGFAAIWWAWMNFTWFASAYDTDDSTYRLWTMLQMAGVLLLAAGVPQLAQGDFSTLTVGYAVMRLSMVAMWLRAAREHPEGRRTALRSALAIFVVQLLWITRLALPLSWMLPSFALLIVVELAIPKWAARAGHTPWHAHHVAERYGLFTIIVLGECVLGATNAVAGVIQAQGWSFDVALVGLGTTGLVLALWWVYFLVPNAQVLHHQRERAFHWGYGHFLVFGTLAALGAFLEVVADQLKTMPGNGTAAPSDAHAAVAPVLAIGLVAGAVGLYLVTIWWLHRHVLRGRARLGGTWIAALAILAGVVVAVAAGLQVAWALLALVLAPGLIIVVVERGQLMRSDLNGVR